MSSKTAHRQNFAERMVRDEAQSKRDEDSVGLLGGQRVRKNEARAQLSAAIKEWRSCRPTLDNPKLVAERRAHLAATVTSTQSTSSLRQSRRSAAAVDSFADTADDHLPVRRPRANRGLLGANQSPLCRVAKTAALRDRHRRVVIATLGSMAIIVRSRARLWC